MERLASPQSAPVLPLLHTVHSLLTQPPSAYVPSLVTVDPSPAGTQQDLGQEDSLTYAMSAMLSVTSAATSAVFDYTSSLVAWTGAGNMWGEGGAGAEGEGARKLVGKEEGVAWCSSTCAIMLLYFLVYFNQMLRSPLVSAEEGKNPGRYLCGQIPLWAGSTMGRFNHGQVPPRAGSTTGRFNHRQDPPWAGSTIDRLHHGQIAPRAGSTMGRLHHASVPLRCDSCWTRDAQQLSCSGAQDCPVALNLCLYS